MAKVILQPCANPLAYSHFEDTIRRPVPVPSLEKYLTANQMEQIEALYPHSVCPIWGIEPKNGGNVKKWRRIKPGDIVFFSRHKKIFASGTVTMTIHNNRLARTLWGDNGNGSTWEYIYLLNDIETRSTPVQNFNEAVRYAPNYPIQGLTILDEERSELALALMNIPASTEEGLENATREQLSRRMAKLQETDGDANVKIRKEQEILRQACHGNKKINTCGICQKDYPITFLATAHIKKRADCSFEERINLDIAMPMCKMGCDQLYESGHISVFEGKVINMGKKPESEALVEYIKTIEGNTCSYFNERTRSFFEYHWNKFNRAHRPSTLI